MALDETRVVSVLFRQAGMEGVWRMRLVRHKVSVSLYIAECLLVTTSLAKSEDPLTTSRKTNGTFIGTHSSGA